MKGEKIALIRRINESLTMARLPEMPVESLLSMSVRDLERLKDKWIAPVVGKLIAEQASFGAPLKKVPSEQDSKKLIAAISEAKEILLDAPLFTIGDRVYSVRQMRKILGEEDSDEKTHVRREVSKVLGKDGKDE